MNNYAKTPTYSALFSAYSLYIKVHIAVYKPVHFPLVEPVRQQTPINSKAPRKPCVTFNYFLRALHRYYKEMPSQALTGSNQHFAVLYLF